MGAAKKSVVDVFVTVEVVVGGPSSSPLGGPVKAGGGNARAAFELYGSSVARLGSAELVVELIDMEALLLVTMGLRLLFC